MRPAETRPARLFVGRLAASVASLIQSAETSKAWSPDSALTFTAPSPSGTVLGEAGVALAAPHIVWSSPVVTTAWGACVASHRLSRQSATQAPEAAGRCERHGIAVGETSPRPTHGCLCTPAPVAAPICACIAPESADRALDHANGALILHRNPTCGAPASSASSSGSTRSAILAKIARNAGHQGGCGVSPVASPLESSRCIQMGQLPRADLSICILASLSS